MHLVIAWWRENLALSCSFCRAPRKIIQVCLYFIFEEHPCTRCVMNIAKWISICPVQQISAAQPGGITIRGACESGVLRARRGYSHSLRKNNNTSTSSSSQVSWRDGGWWTAWRKCSAKCGRGFAALPYACAYLSFHIKQSRFLPARYLLGQIQLQRVNLAQLGSSG